MYFSIKINDQYIPDIIKSIECDEIHNTVIIVAKGVNNVVSRMNLLTGAEKIQETIGNPIGGKISRCIILSDYLGCKTLSDKVDACTVFEFYYTLKEAKPFLII